MEYAPPEDVIAMFEMADSKNNKATRWRITPAAMNTILRALKSAPVAEPIAPELSDAQIVAIHRLFYPMDTPDFKYVIACHREAIAADRRLK